MTDDIVTNLSCPPQLWSPGSMLQELLHTPPLSYLASVTWSSSVSPAACRHCELCSPPCRLWRHRGQKHVSSSKHHYCHYEICSHQLSWKMFWWIIFLVSSRLVTWFVSSLFFEGSNERSWTKEQNQESYVEHQECCGDNFCPVILLKLAT